MLDRVLSPAMLHVCYEFGIGGQFIQDIVRLRLIKSTGTEYKLKIKAKVSPIKNTSLSCYDVCLL